MFKSGSSSVECNFPRIRIPMHAFMGPFLSGVARIPLICSKNIDWAYLRSSYCKFSQDPLISSLHLLYKVISASKSSGISSDARLNPSILEKGFKLKLRKLKEIFNTKHDRTLPRYEGNIGKTYVDLCFFVYDRGDGYVGSSRCLWKREL